MRSEKRISGIKADLSYTGFGLDDAIRIASDLRVNNVLTELDLRGNRLGTKGWCAIFNALKENKSNKIKAWNLSPQGIDPAVVKTLVEYVSVSTVLTSLNLNGSGRLWNKDPWLTIPDQRSLESNGVGDEGAKALAFALKVNAVLTSLR